METYVKIAIVIAIILAVIGIALIFKKENFTTLTSQSEVIHPIIISQAPEYVQESNTNMNNIIPIFVSNIGKDNQIVTLALALISALEEQNGLPAGDYYTGNYTGLWTCVVNSNKTSVTWTFNKVPNAVATTFPVTDIVILNLPEDLTNTYWSCRPNHAVGVPTLLRLNVSPSMSVWDGTTWN